MFIESEFLPSITAFLFVFAVVYGLLARANLFGGINTRVAAVVALVVAFFTIMYEPFVSYMQGLMPIAAIILIILFFIVLIQNIIGSKAGESADSLPIVVVLAVLLLVLGLLWDKLAIRLPGISSENILWLIGIVIIAMIFIAVYKHPKQS